MLKQLAKYFLFPFSLIFCSPSYSELPSPKIFKTDKENSWIEFHGEKNFIHGINHAWLDGKYDHDFALNHLHPSWGVEYNASHVENYLSDMQNMGAKVVRLWLMEGLEGLVFDSSRNKVTDLRPELLTNFDDFLKRCKNHGLFCYLCLTDTFLNVGERNYLSILTDEQRMNSYLENAVRPIAQRYGNNPNIFAFDIMNEPESDISGNNGNWTPNGVSWQQMQNFLSKNVQVIKEEAPNLLVSAGSGYHGLENVTAGFYSGLGLDFYDAHIYDDNGNFPSFNSLGLDLPCLIGEYGQASGSWNDELQRSVTQNLINNSFNNDFAGELIWQYNYPGCSEIYTLINSDSSWRPACFEIQDFALSHSFDIDLPLATSPTKTPTKIPTPTQTQTPTRTLTLIFSTPTPTQSISEKLFNLSNSWHNPTTPNDLIELLEN